MTGDTFMTTATTASDIFEMAAGMERIGKDFYEALAGCCDNSKVREFCLRAAVEETNHLAAFHVLRDRWRQSAATRPVSPDEAAALAAVAKQHIQPDPQSVHAVAVGGSLPNALNLAIGMEQDSVRFYQGLLSVCPDSAQVIRSIIAEENKHLGSLRLLRA